jgi:hypothetical protein
MQPLITAISSRARPSCHLFQSCQRNALSVVDQGADEVPVVTVRRDLVGDVETLVTNHEPERDGSNVCRRGMRRRLTSHVRR